MIFKRQVKVQPVAYLSLNMALYWKAQWERIKKSRRRTSGPPAFWAKPIRCVVKAWGCLCRLHPVDIIPPCPHPSSRQNQAITSSTQLRLSIRNLLPEALFLSTNPASFSSLFHLSFSSPHPPPSLLFSFYPSLSYAGIYLLNMHFLSTSH